ncbi:MAG: hydrogenase iron-sulfur subunit [Thermodesulfobacterium sp.]|nr:hydrogenase iron-sulfur subunit [Thermodesulfobacterium sp.]
MSSFQKIKLAIILCTCGGVLEEKIDFNELKNLAASFPETVEVLKFHDFCKEPEKKLAHLKGKINGLIIGGCSERSSLSLNEDRIKKLLNFLEIDTAFFETVNLREQCAFIHSDPIETTKKALDLLLMAYEKLKINLGALVVKDIKKEVLIIGGGVAGLSCAQSLSDLGVNVTLIEEKPYIGGHAVEIPLLWQGEGSPSVCASDCVLPVIGRDTLIKDNINLLTNSRILDIIKNNGNFQVKIEKRSLKVDPQKCIGCGKCVEVCPEEIPSELDLGLKTRKAIDKPFRLAMPDTYHILEEACTKCGECVKVCPTDAINLDAKNEIIEKEFGGIVLATGFKGYDMNVFENLGYKFPNVVTMLEFERLWANRFKGKPPISIAFVLCQKDEVGYCSRLCCLATLKHAVRLSMAYLGTEVNVFYKSLRACGRAFEEFKKEAEIKGVGFLQEEVEKIEEGEDGFLKIITNQGEYEADLVVLAEPLVPSEMRILKMLGVETDQYGFPIEFQPRVVRPLETYVERVFVVGTAKGFKDVQESIESGAAGALKIYNALKGTEKKYFSITDIEKCSKCGICISVCPHGAIKLSKDEIKIDPTFCRGCGLCYSTCPSNAIKLINLEEFQIMKMVENAFKHLSKDKPRILAFLCYWCSYGAGDLMGIYREKVPENFRSIRVRCSASVSLDLIMEIISQDLVDGILIAGCPVKNCHHLWGNYIQDRRFTLFNKVLKEMGFEGKIVRWEYVGITMWKELAKIIRSMNESLSKVK